MYVIGCVFCKVLFIGGSTPMMLMWLKIDCRGPGGFSALEAQVSFESIHHQSPHNVVPIVIKNPFSRVDLR